MCVCVCVCVCVSVCVCGMLDSTSHQYTYIIFPKEIDEQNGRNVYSLRSILIEADLSHYSGTATMS